MNIIPVKSPIYNNDISFKARRNPSLALQCFSNSVEVDKSSESRCYKSYFEGLQRSREHSQIFTNLIHSKGRLNRQDYDSLNSQEKEEIIQSAKDYLSVYYRTKYRVTPDIFVDSAKSLKSYFDNKFGENSYRIISLGTSPAAIAQAMEYMGNEVIYLPISGLHEEDREEASRKDYDYYKKFRNMNTAISYLEHLGLKKDDKKNILLDYTVSGHTLSIVKNAIKEHFNISDRDIFAFDIIDTLVAGQKEEGENPRLTIDEINSLANTMGFQEVEQISSVPHFYVQDNANFLTPHSVFSWKRSDETVFQHFEKFSTPLAKVFSICMLDEVEKKENN